jgi:hypothetical protein
MSASARCPHKVIWYRVCHWCQAEANRAYLADGFENAHRYTFWRNAEPHKVAEEKAMYVALQMMRRKVEAWE